MIDRVNQHNHNSELSAKKTETGKTQHESPKPQSVLSAKSFGTVASNTPRSAAALSVALGLPQDKLSSAIISFARFFSLPLKPQLLANLRRYALMPSAAKAALSEPAVIKAAATKVASQTANQSSAAANAAAAKMLPANALVAGDANASFTAEKTRQAASLSAAAAESKGTELSPEGLESYTEAVDPESRRQDSDGQQSGFRRRRRNREQDENAEKNSLKSEAVKKSQYEDSSSTQLFTADSLKKMSLEYAEQNPLLEILNKLPCKNGQRWVVLPFDFIEDDKKFNVSMRLLLDDDNSLNRAVCMTLDILESVNIESALEHDGKQEHLSGEATSERRWLFVMESVNEKPLRVSVYLQGELSQKSHSKFKSELSNLFNMPVEHINIINRTEPFPYEASFAENFSSIDEAV
ncbi:hypothetical protein [Treponema sp. R80B11-R83G3]